MTITTPGALLIKSMLPTESARSKFDVYKPLTKGGIKDLVNLLIQHGGPTAHETINDLTKLFFDKATEIGSTTPMTDYMNDSEERQVLFQEFEHRLTEILKKKLPKLEQAKVLSTLAAEMSGKMERSNLAYMVSRSSTAANMAKTGARGNPMQLSQGTASPMMAADVRGYPIPVAIKHSFAEGLSSSEHLAMSYGGRSSTVLAQLSTEKPGSLFKKLIPAMFHEVITEPDCGTKNGIPQKISDKLGCLGKYEAGTNKLIDEQYLKELVASGKKQIIARNVMTCKAKEGLCQKCYGLAATGQLPEIGQNMGVIATQSVSEVLTQAMLGSKHTGGLASSSRNPYELANNILSNPESFQDEATLAEVNGRVDKIDKTSLNDWEVKIGDKTHFIPNVQEPTVNIGDHVRVGDMISTGTANPRKLTELKGAGAGRIYLSNKMREIYSRNGALDPRHFDIVARNLIKHSVVTDPGESGFMPGDKIEVGMLESYLAKHSKKVPLASSLGKTLAARTLGLTAGTIMTQNHIDDLSAQGITEVPVSNSSLKTEALVPGLQNLKFLDKNWISRLSFNRLHHSIMEAGAMAQSSPIHGTEPVTAYMIGNEFGEGGHGKY